MDQIDERDFADFYYQQNHAVALNRDFTKKKYLESYYMERLALNLRPEPFVRRSFGSSKEHDIVIVNQDDGMERDLGAKQLAYFYKCV